MLTTGCKNYKILVALLVEERHRSHDRREESADDLA
jgi:hypothetical protein